MLEASSFTSLHTERYLNDQCPFLQKIKKEVGKKVNTEKIFIEASSFTSLSTELRNITQLHHGAKGLQDFSLQKNGVKIAPT